MVPQCGFDSVPPDINAFIIAQELKIQVKSPTKEILNCLYNFVATASGGTSLTIVSLFEHYPLAFLAKTLRAYAISPIPPSRNAPKPPKPLLFRLFGIQYSPTFGWLTNWFQAPPDIAIVHRSWGLLQQSSSSHAYGPDFRFHELKRASNPVSGMLLHLILTLGGLFLIFSPGRWLAKKLIYAPGTGPEMSKTSKDVVDYRAIGIADNDKKTKARGRFLFKGSMYSLTALTMAEAAMVILRGNGKSDAVRMGGGIVTSACLGIEFIDRLKSAGVVIESRIVPDGFKE
jgi:short subunit dehydrogenase-like uncharacterized protein